MIYISEMISIILPIFNVDYHLRGGIDSLINQTIGQENLEIIMVNICQQTDHVKLLMNIMKNMIAI